MFKNRIYGILGFIVVSMMVFSMIACSDGSGSSSGGGRIPTALVGEWASKSNPSVMMFKITSDGTFTATGQSGGDFDKISVSGNTVEIKMQGSTIAAFNYSISNGELAITNATGFMATIALASPFVKVGSNNGGTNGNIPSELVGEWASKANPSDMVFKITSDGTFTATGQSGGDFDKISVSGNTVEIKVYGSTVASFVYSISNGEMTFTNATGFMASLALISPFVKVGSNNGGGEGDMSALVGKWGKQENMNFVVSLEITSAGKLISSDGTTYDITVSGSTVTLKFGGTDVGTFGFAISDDKMIMHSGTGIGITIAALSPLDKQSGDGAPSELVETFTVTFVLNGGRVDGSFNDVIILIMKSGETVMLPDAPLPELGASTFGGWFFDNGSFRNQWDGNFLNITESTYLYAMWIDTEIPGEPDD
ncbi:MAG: InlB B-repeat-containing protein [Treponema sp.]|nr:InlB B-repeat-containing protein [Treponema sp.]